MANRQLYLLRHGKSSWDEDLPDRQRPLAARGERAAELMGRFLADVGEAPDRVLTSTAVRAATTAALAASAGRWRGEIVDVPELYGATATELLDVVAGRAGAAERVVVVGHEPTMSQAIGTLCGRQRVRFPTAALARLDLDVGRWEGIARGSGELRWLVTPRLLQSAGRR